MLLTGTYNPKEGQQKGTQEGKGFSFSPVKLHFRLEGTVGGKAINPGFGGGEGFYHEC